MPRAPLDCGKVWSTGFRPPLAVPSKPPGPMQLVRHKSIDPNVPAIIPEDQQQNFKAFLDRVLDDVVGAASPGIIQAGDDLWLAIATIAVTWTGLQVAFSGSFNLWEIVKLVIVLSIPKTCFTTTLRPSSHHLYLSSDGSGAGDLAAKHVCLRHRLRHAHGTQHPVYPAGNAILAAWQRIDIETCRPLRHTP